MITNRSMRGQDLINNRKGKSVAQKNRLSLMKFRLPQKECILKHRHLDNWE